MIEFRFVEFSWRYMVGGIYKDRSEPIWRFYLPFVRVSLRIGK